MTKEYSIAMSEFLYLLNGFPKEEIDKIPRKIIKYFEDNCDKNHICSFDYNDDLNNIHLKEETYGIISVICYNYWCITEQDKQRYSKILIENENNYQKELKEKYTQDNIFKTINNQENVIKQNEEIRITVTTKENLFKKIINFINAKLFGKKEI